MKSPLDSTRDGKSSASGVSGSTRRAYQALRKGPAGDGRRAFPPGVVIAVKALACELPHQHGIPVSRLSTSEIQRAAVERGLVASIGKTTVWRWLSEDAIRPWCHRTWIFPRDPKFAQKAGAILDLYQGVWQGKPLTAGDFVISTDEKTSIQARRRKHRSTNPGPRERMRVEHEYQRCGAWAYLAAWDVRRAKVFGDCVKTTGIVPFEGFVAQVMKQKPYRSAKRVFWIMDNGSSHRGEASVTRLRRRWPNLVCVHTPIHASWLNQVEIYFSIVQRKVLTPNDFDSLAAVRDRLFAFQEHYAAIAKPFDWKFTRKDLAKVLAKLDERQGVAA
jgi:DDE superfamily endonuclease